MTYDSNSKSSAQLEREVEQQRDRVEARLSEIKERLSPGQLLDEALAYTKNGGANFASISAPRFLPTQCLQLWLASVSRG